MGRWALNKEIVRPATEQQGPMELSFFEESTEQSLVKATIVAKYFWAWAKVVISATRKRADKIAYIDLFAGPGRYKDGTQSTPLMVLEKAVEDPDIRERLVTIFNDVDVDNTKSLQEAINNIPGIEKLKYKPQMYSHTVGEEIVKMFRGVKLVPTLFFVDPWGYKGLSLQLINSVLKDWGCDCIFFFNYNRISMGLNNALVQEHMDALFGKERAEHLRGRLGGMRPGDRELAIVEELVQALREMGGNYVLPFRFMSNTGVRTSHHLVFVSKHFKGYEIMKGIMAAESSRQEQGVPSFEYNPADERFPALLELNRPLDELQEMLLTEFAGRRMRMVEVYQAHSVGRPFIRKNYKEALKKMEAEGSIRAKPSSEERPKGTFADNVLVIFPKRGA